MQFHLLLQRPLAWKSSRLFTYPILKSRKATLIFKIPIINSFLFREFTFSIKTKCLWRRFYFYLLSIVNSCWLNASAQRDHTTCCWINYSGQLLLGESPLLLRTSKLLLHIIYIRKKNLSGLVFLFTELINLSVNKRHVSYKSFFPSSATQLSSRCLSIVVC